MASIEFSNNGNNILIQCDINDKMEEIINKYILKSSIDKSSVIFLYSGNIINEELKLSEIIGKEEKDKIKIIVVDSEEDNKNNNKSKIKSRYIICPKCKENIKYKMNEYKIYLYECKNGHRMNNILLNEFKDTQYIDISKIICDICKEKNKSETYKNEFYKCIECEKNICPLCKLSHDKSHNIINYDQKNYICLKHNDIYSRYCNKCKMNICFICENEHKDHETISYGDMIPNEKEIKKYMNELRESIDKFKDNIEEIKNKLDKVKENIEIYYNINEEIIKNFEKRNRNYEILI